MLLWGMSGVLVSFIPFFPSSFLMVLSSSVGGGNWQGCLSPLLLPLRCCHCVDTDRHETSRPTGKRRNVQKERRIWFVSATSWTTWVLGCPSGDNDISLRAEYDICEVDLPICPLECATCYSASWYLRPPTVVSRELIKVLHSVCMCSTWMCRVCVSSRSVCVDVSIPQSSSSMCRSVCSVWVLISPSHRGVSFNHNFHCTLITLIKLTKGMRERKGGSRGQCDWCEV